MDSSTTTSRRAFLGTAAAGGVAGVAGLAGLAATAAPAAAVTPRPRQVDLAFTHATVVDGTGARPRPDTTVLVAGDRIVGVGRSAEVAVPRGATVVNLRGKHLIPGLTDAHLHTSDPRIDYPLGVANGLTTIREMWGHAQTREWKAQVEAGKLLGPRCVIASGLMDGDPSLWGDPNIRPAAPIVVRTPAQGRAAVRAEVRDGADFVKVYSRLSRATFHAIADECQRQGIAFGGHCPDDVTVEEAVAAGQWTFEHGDGLWWSVSRRDAELRRRAANFRIHPTDPYDSWFKAIGELEWSAATSYDERVAERLFRRLRGSGSWQCPTLTVERRIDIPDGSHDPRMKYTPPDLAAFWKQFAAGITATRTPKQVAEHTILFRRRQRLVGALADAGVPIIAGTDTGTTYLWAGTSLHDELILLVEAGLTPMHALRAATSEPARALGLSHTAGTVAVGKNADLLALDADPLADIRNIRRVHSVVLRGRYIDPARRRALLAEAEKAAQTPPPSATPRQLSCGCR